MRMPKFTYLISNRSPSSPDDQIGPVVYQRAPNYNDRAYKRDGFVNVSVDDWAGALAADLAARYAGSSDPWDLAFYIHGYATSEPYGRIGLESFGLALSAVGVDRGILVGVSWPSDTYTYGGAQDNAVASTALINAVGKIITRVRATTSARVRVSIFCHSMGNYLLSTTLSGTAKLPGVDSLFMLAADVGFDVWVPASGNYPQGLALAAAATQLYVFHTTNDTVLWDSGVINDDRRLGYQGASSGSTVPPNVAQFDYSAYGQVPYCEDYVPYSDWNYGAWTGALVHSSSKFVPDLLSFFRACLENPPPGRVDVPPTRDLAKLRRSLGKARAQAPARRAATRRGTKKRAKV
jgi:hypothetical protein